MVMALNIKCSMSIQRIEPEVQVELADYHAEPEKYKANASVNQPYFQRQADYRTTDSEYIFEDITMHPAKAIKRAVRLLLEVL